MKIGAIILAAGASTRMGTSKQMLQVNGEYLLTRTIKTVEGASIDNIVVVLGARDALHRTIINAQVHVVTNEAWAAGMGSSIKSGLQSLLSEHPDLDAVIILVCDQPMLTSEIIAGIISTFHTTRKPIVASGYSDSAGVPALFARSYFDKLNELPDDQGAKKVILQNSADVVVVPFPGGAIDLDTMEDYQKFVKTGHQ
ncbi:MAG TPA: nucleotidyltransferase family protein [Chryseosolibacter sp.]|nr:nucleotidyltransferase family protein [Chryseosolibacter sp.]